MEKETIDIVERSVGPKNESKFGLGVLCALSWAWSGLFLLGMWIAISSTKSLAQGYDVFEVGGEITRNYVIQLATIIGSAVVIVSTFLLYFNIKIGLIPYVIGHAIAMSMQVYFYWKHQGHPDHTMGKVLMWGIVPLVFIFSFSAYFLANRTKKDKKEVAFL